MVRNDRPVWRTQGRPQQQFGGDPDDITIHGQSGGGGAIMTQLVLYDGQKPNYQKAIPRSNQNYAAYKVQDLTVSVHLAFSPSPNHR